MSQKTASQSTTAVALLALAQSPGLTHALSPFRKPCENAFTTKDTCGEDEGLSNGFKLAIIIVMCLIVCCIITCVICYKCKDRAEANARAKHLKELTRGRPAPPDPAIIEMLAKEAKQREEKAAALKAKT